MQKYKRRKGSKWWTSVPVIKTMGTRCPPPSKKDSPCFPMKSSKIKRENYPQGVKVEIEISHKYHKYTHPPYSIHMHTLVWLYASILYGSFSWLYNTCIASMLILVIGTPISSTIYIPLTIGDIASLMPQERTVGPANPTMEPVGPPY